MGLLRKIVTVGSGTMMSRIFGFVREMMMAAILGTGPVADAFNAAFRFPNSFRRLFAEGAFNSAFVPLFARSLDDQGMTEARRFSSEVFGVLFSILLILTIAMELLMPLIVAYVIAPGFTQDTVKFEATVRLALVMFPYLGLMSLGAMMGGMLNALHRYFAAAIAPVFLNIILIAILLYAWIQGFDVWQVGISLSWGVMASGMVQLLIVWLALRHAGMKIGWRWPRLSANVRRLLWLAMPAAMTGGITQINLLINTNIASQDGGAVSSLAYADRLYQLPLGIIGIAVATVLLPELSRALRGGRSGEVHDLQNRAVEFSLFLTLPASAVLVILPETVVQLLFERGSFDSGATAVVSAILMIYGLGLPAFVLIKALIPGFFAREDSKTPMIFAAISVAVNITLALILFPLFSARGIAMAEITAAWVNIALLLVTLVKRGYWQVERRSVARIARLIPAAIMMGFVLYTGAHYGRDWLTSQAPFGLQIGGFFVLMAASSSLYLILVFVTGAMDIRDVGRALRRR